MRKKKSLFGAILCICTLFAVLVGCPTEPEPEDKTKPVDPRYSLGVDNEALSVYVPIGKYFTAPKPVDVIVTNTGELPTENLIITIKNDAYNLFDLSTDEITSLEVGEKALFSVILPQNDPGWNANYEIDVEIGNENVTKTFKVKYGAFFLKMADFTGLPDFIQAGGGRTISPTVSGKESTMPWFSGNNGVTVPKEDGTFDLVGGGEAIIGYVTSDEPFAVTGMAVKVYPESLPPYIVSAQTEDSSRDKIQVTFNKAVDKLDMAKFKVKVNNKPVGAAFPYEETSLSDIRDITAVTGADTVWTLTMSKPAEYGEILRLHTNASGAAYEKNNVANALPEINQFIVRSLVKRTRPDYEKGADAGGFYIDGVKQDTPADATLLKSAISAINSAAEKNDKTWTVVLDEAQLGFNPGGTFSGGSAGQYLGSTLIITTNGNTDINVFWANNGGVFTARNGLTIIVDEHIVFTGLDPVNNASYTGNNNHFMMAMDQGKIILDGCEFRNNIATQGSDNAGALRVGGGSNGAILLINNAKIIGNKAINNTTSSSVIGYGGAISLSDRSILVIHDGEISGNTAGGTNANIPRAGAIATRILASAQQPVAVYITGGVIKDNIAEVSGDNTGAAGGLFIGASFQKSRGAIIKDNSVSGGFTGNVNSNNVALIKSGWKANPDLATAILYNGAVGATDDTLSNTVLSTDPLVSVSYKISDWAPPKGSDDYPWDN